MKSPMLLLSRAAADRLPLWICLTVAIAISLVTSWHYLPVTMDDALIGYRYSERLLNGDGLTWNDGEFVEGYSNLLWILIVAGGGLLHPDLILVGWILGLIANISVLAAVLWTFGRTPGGSFYAVASGLLMLSLSGSFAFWAVAGMETALVGALLAWSLATTDRMGIGRWAWIRPAVLLGLLSITRPDGILFGVSIAIAVILRDGFNRGSFHIAIRLLSVPLVFFIGQIGFRLAYYDALIPNTAYAKLAFTIERVLLGGLYLTRGTLVNFVPLMLILVAALLLCRSHGWKVLRQSSLFLVPGLIWLAYVGFIGGDFFPFQRHWIPALICFAFTLGSLALRYTDVAPRRFALLATVAAVLNFLFQSTADPWELQFGKKLQIETVLTSVRRSLNPFTQSDKERSMRLNYARCDASGRFMLSAFGVQQPLLAVYPAGCLPYKTKFPSIDMLGLTDAYIARHRPPNMGKGPLSHELGDAPYVLSRKPDLMDYCHPDTYWCRIYGGLSDNPEFQAFYRLVFYRVGSKDIALWTRIEDGRIGIVREANTIYIPGFLLATTPEARATLDSNSTLVTEVSNGHASIENVYLPTGTWEVLLITDPPSGLQLLTTPVTNTEVVQPNLLRIVSHGAPRSFHASGHGKVLSIRAKKID